MQRTIMNDYEGYKRAIKETARAYDNGDYDYYESQIRYYATVYMGGDENRFEDAVTEYREFEDVEIG